MNDLDEAIGAALTAARNGLWPDWQAAFEAGLSAAAPIIGRQATANMTKNAEILADELIHANARLAEVERERDSLARRCAIRFEETERLRADREWVISDLFRAADYLSRVETRARDDRERLVFAIDRINAALARLSPAQSVKPDNTKETT